MRRSDREVANPGEILRILEKCDVVRLGINAPGHPYIVPMNFGYTFAENALTLYFHCAAEGKKIDILHANPRACFEIDADHSLITADTACKYGFRYASVIGSGSVCFIEDIEEKRCGLNVLMRHQTGTDRDFYFSDDDAEQVLVFKLNVTEFTGKKHL